VVVDGNVDVNRFAEFISSGEQFLSRVIAFWLLWIKEIPFLPLIMKDEKMNGKKMQTTML
jgi:hypothetical protein